MRVRANIVPGFFTMANMFCGYYSTILSATAYTSNAPNEKYILAAWLIIAAAVLDVLDGKLARLTGTASPFGVQYDSLADVVSFGLAPSALSYFVFFYKWDTLGLLVSFIPLVFGSIRLARFNVQLKGLHKDHFKGLPIPAAAVTICTFILFNYEIWGHLRWIKIFFLLILMVSFLMISNIRYEMMPNFSLNAGLVNSIKVLIVAAGTIMLVLYPYKLFFPLAVLYIVSGVIGKLFSSFNNNNSKDSAKQEKDK